MPFIELNLDDIHEPKPVSGGQVYDLVIASAEEGVSKEGKPQIRCSIGIEGHDDAPNITHFISLPHKADDADKAKFKQLFLKRFVQAFRIPVNGGINTDDFPGARARLELGLSEPDKDSGAVYNRLVLPKLKEEGGTAGTVTKPPKR